MGTIHFVSDLESSALKALKDAEDCADIVNDLGRIYYTITHGSEQDARALDHEMLQKYPAIDALLRVADTLQTAPISSYFAAAKSVPSAKSNLQQDYWGIICDAAIKKGIKKSIEDCIDYIEFFSIMQTKNVRMKWSAANNGVHRSQGSSTI